MRLFVNTKPPLRTHLKNHIRPIAGTALLVLSCGSRIRHLQVVLIVKLDAYAFKQNQYTYWFSEDEHAHQVRHHLPKRPEQMNSITKHPSYCVITKYGLRPVEHSFGCGVVGVAPHCTYNLSVSHAVSGEARSSRALRASHFLKSWDDYKDDCYHYC